MKYLIVTVRRETNPNLPTMKYPQDYKPLDVDANKRGPLIYDQGLAKGADTEEMMLFVADRVADQYALDTDMRIVTEAEADTWLGNVERIQERPEEVVTDVDRLTAIIAKNAAGVALTPEDLKALDPDDPIRGINRKLKTAASLFSGR